MPHATQRTSHESSRRYSKAHTHERDHHRHHDSRTFDCCSRPPQEPRPSRDGRSSQSLHRDAHQGGSTWSQGHSAPSTYGTYIWPLETRGQYATMDPTRCRCTCCPHPSSVSRSPKERPAPPRRDPSPPPLRYDSPRPAETPRRSAKRSSEDRRQPRDEFVVDVVDRWHGSTLRHQYGDRYPVTLSSTASVASVLEFLAPDERRTKVIVHWNDGDREPLDDKVPMDEIRRFGKYLEVKERKRVHWG
ncbi:hypothetical protein AK830_g967 [Neonectria ditissima]|uniref:Uncharacterized protein n=1 Tax=Neonectria ditissima TaxID=78410 RepID=A0A0P7BVQ3_9HYPO|nr:hypothetical protein AK830_g967 [Neonectria ditissima]